MKLIRVISYASAGEAPILARALDDLLPNALTESKVRVERNDAADLAQLIDQPEGTIRIVSLLPFAMDGEVPWAEREQALTSDFAALAQAGDPVFVMTVFRAVGERHAKASQDLLLRIRRLNLLATEVSREHGALVVDIDRILSDIGGLWLGTDYRLQGDIAAGLAGHELALKIATYGLDQSLPFEAQERARARIEAERPVLKTIPSLSPSDLVALGKGRSRQHVSVYVDAVQESHASWLLKQVLERKIGPGEALGRLSAAIRRRGWRESFGLLASATKQSVSKKRQT